MSKTTVVSSLILLMSAVAAQQYSGPRCLGSFCVDHPVPMGQLFARLGRPTTKAPEFSPYCFQAKDSHTFMYIVPIHAEPEAAGEVLLSDFPNCVHLNKQVTANNLLAWRTLEGIGLGSPETDVRKAYGKPSSETTIDDFTVEIRVKGYQSGDPLPHLGDRTLFYHGDVTADLSAAEFGIRNGKVSYIWLSQNE